MSEEGLKHWRFVCCSAALQNSAPFHTFAQCLAPDNTAHNYLILLGLFGGPGRDRTDDLFHAIRKSLRVLPFRA